MGNIVSKKYTYPASVEFHDWIRPAHILKQTMERRPDGIGTAAIMSNGRVISVNSGDYVLKNEDTDEIVSVKKEHMESAFTEIEHPRVYTKKPIDVIALKFTGTNSKEVIEFVGRNVGFINSNLKITTIDGVMTAYPGDYIIRGVNGEFYPCKPNVFNLTYHLNFNKFAVPDGQGSYKIEGTGLLP